MKILYLTNAIKEEDYNFLLKKGYPLINPSNQNFHTRLIKVLSSLEEVNVLSLVPTKTKPYRLLDSELFHYVQYPLFHIGPYKTPRLQETKTIARELIENIDLILLDPLNYTLRKTAIYLKKKYRLALIYVMTDNPRNITNFPGFLARKYQNDLKYADATLSLKEGLAIKGKPSLMFPGLLDEEAMSDVKNIDEQYLYYGGNLRERFGFYTFASAYLKSSVKIPLFFSGSFISPELLNLTNKNPHRLKYLGLLSRMEHLKYLKNAELVINPRPYQENLARESFPSKLMEDVHYAKKILSTYEETFFSLFPDDINWLKGDKEEDFLTFLNAHQENGSLNNLLINEGRERLISLYGNKALSEKIHLFLTETFPVFEKEL